MELLKLARIVESFDNAGHYGNFLKMNNAVAVDSKGADARIFSWDAEKAGNKEFYAMAFVGKAQKPTWMYKFRSENDRQNHIDKTIESAKSRKEEKTKRMDERKEYQHDLKVDDILVASWGYDQTNIDFFQVIKVVGKKIVIRKIASKVVDSGSTQNKVVAVKDSFIDEPMIKIPKSGYNGKVVVKIASYEYAYLWDGTPRYETDALSGH